jgi:hypothetical protein
MAQSKDAVLALLTQNDRDNLVAALKGWAEDGVKDPQIPLDHDVDGDGIVDAWALDENGELTLVNAVSVADTVSVSDGSGIETSAVA